MILTTLDLKRMRSLRYEDGLSAAATAAIIGCGVSAVYRYAPGRPGKVPNDKLREAFERSGITAAEVARRMGWVHASTWQRADGTKCPDVSDSSRVKRALGIMSDINGRGVRSIRNLIDAETAGLMAEALGLMAWEVLPDDEQMAA